MVCLVFRFDFSPHDDVPPAMLIFCSRVFEIKFINSLSDSLSDKINQRPLHFGSNFVLFLSELGDFLLQL